MLFKGVCDEPAGVTGPCKAGKTRWTFDNWKMKCEKFEYGGCKGNGNNFMSKAECRKECGLYKHFSPIISDERKLE